MPYSQNSDSTASPDTTAQRYRELEALHLASTFLHRLRDPAVLARDVVTLLKDVIHHDFAAVYLCDGDHLRTFAVSDRGLGPGVLDSDFAYLDSLRLKVGENITGWVAQHGKSLRLDDVAQDSRYLDSQEGIQSELCVPMFSGSAVLGVVNLESTRPSAYQDSDQRLLEIVANQIAVAIENARLLEKMSDMKRLQLLAELTGGVAHDIGNMLVAMSLRCDLVRMSWKLTEAQQEELTAIRSVLDKSIALSRSLLQVGLPTPATADTIELNKHLQSTLPLMQTLGGNRMSVSFERCEDPAYITASAGQIDQILINLVVNARAAVGDDGSVVIRTRRVQSQDKAAVVCLEVQDNGCGMTPDARAAAMQPMFTTREGGFGLGLATVARLVEDLNGKIELESTESVGTLVRMTFPLAKHDARLASDRVAV